MKYAHIDKNNGRVLGWYSDDIHGVLIQAEVDENGKLLKDEYYDVSKIPTPNIEVNETVWKKAIEINANAYDKDKKTFVVKDFRTADEIEKDAEYESKLQKEEELKSLTIDINTVLYDANQEALGNMATVIAIANATYNKAISVGIIVDDTNTAQVLSLVDAYNYVYKNQTVTWKGADNKPHTVQLESLVEASQKAMTAKAEILFKY